MRLQKQFKGFVAGSFEFHNTRSRMRIVTKEMVNFSAIKTFLEMSKLSFYTFFLKSEKPIKAVTRHLPHNTPAEDISDRLVSLGFDVISVKQMTTTCWNPPPERTSTVNLPLFLITLPRTAKYQEIFRLNNLCHISIKVEAYKAQNVLTQCCNCQQFDHVWENCKQLLVVWRRPPAQGVPTQRKHGFNTNLLQLPVGGRGKGSPLKLQGLQAREGGVAQEKVPENTQNHNR
jgi:hypothetical protein